MGYSIKGRATNAKLGEADVRRMRREHSLGLKTPRQLAQEFGLAAETVRKVLRYETFAWVGEEGPGGMPPAVLPQGDFSPEAVLARLQAQGLAPASTPLGEQISQANKLLGELDTPSAKTANSQQRND